MTMMSDEKAADDGVEPGALGSGENVCPKCNGTGHIEKAVCQICDGTGKVTEGIGGG
jgi:DnaJ-class molecular chaperone